MSKLHVRKDDEVEVISGGAKGKRGKVLQVNIAKNQVIVEGARRMVKATKPQQGVEGGLVEKDGPIHISNVKVVLRAQRKDKKEGK